MVGIDARDVAGTIASGHGALGLVEFFRRVGAMILLLNFSIACLKILTKIFVAISCNKI